MDVYCVLFDRKLSASHDSNCQPLSGMTNCEIDEVHWNAVGTQDSITRAPIVQIEFVPQGSFIVPWRKFLALPLTIYRLAALLRSHHVAHTVKFCTNFEQNEPEMRYRVWDIIYSLIHTLLIILFQHSRLLQKQMFLLSAYNAPLRQRQSWSLLSYTEQAH